MKKTVLASVLLGNALFAGCNETPPTVCCEEMPRPMRITARHIETGGIGYNQGYTTVEGFFGSANLWENWVLFLDARGHVFNNGKPAANAGWGARYLSGSRIWGGNLYYDYRKTTHQHYNQVAMGLESLGEILDFRLNGYLPVGKKKSSYYNTQFSTFEGNNAILRQKYEFAMAGVNGEMGTHIDVWKNYPMYFAFGPYYLTGKGASAWGGEARFSLKIYEHLKLEGYTSYDHLFKWTGQGQIGLTFPFGGTKKLRQGKESCLIGAAQRFYEPVDRFEIIPVDKKHRYSPAINPATGEPYVFFFVNNLSHSAGTYESPYNTLVIAEAASSPYDIIYVFPGDGTTTGMSSGITLKNHQFLWGSSVTQTLPTSVGNINIPAMSTLAPTITNGSGSDVVTLSNNNQISGVYLQNVAAAAIAGTNISNLTVQNSSLVSSGSSASDIGINCTNLSGALTINSTTLNQYQNGINLTSNSDALTTTITNSNLSSSASFTLSWGVNGTGNGTLIVQNSELLTNSYAILIQTDTETSFATTISNNQITANGIGIGLENNGAMTATIQENSIFAYGDTIYLALAEGTLTATISNNSLQSFDNSGIEFQQTDGSSFLIVTDNIMNSDYGLYAVQQGGTSSVTFNDNIVSSLDGGAIQWMGENSAISSVLNLSGNTMNCYYPVSITQSTGNLSLTSSEDTLNGLNYGFSIELSNPSSTVVIENATAYAGSAAISLLQTAGTTDLSLTDSTMITADGNSVSIALAGDSATTTITNNIITGTSSGGSDALVINSSVSGAANNTITGNTLAGTLQALAIGNSSGTLTANISNNTVSNGGGYSLAVSGGSASWTVDNNTISGANNTPVAATASGSGNACMHLNNNAAYPVTGAYALTNSGSGTFTLNPPQSNIGTITETGTIISGSCN